MVKQTKLLASPKFGSFQGSTSASLKIGEFLKLGVALILRYLMTDLLIMQTKLAKIRSSATRPLPSDFLGFHGQKQEEHRV